jgi:hypothetical protein
MRLSTSDVFTFVCGGSGGELAGPLRRVTKVDIWVRSDKRGSSVSLRSVLLAAVFVPAER